MLRWACIAALGVGWYVWLAPNGLGGPVGIVWVSGTSMEPTMHTGDLAIVYERNAYDVGDIVAFEIPGGGIVIHRVSAAEDGLYRFRGDNRDFVDPWQLDDRAIVGREVLTIPHAGSLATFLGRPTSLAMLVTALTLLWWFGRSSAEAVVVPAAADVAREPIEPPTRRVGRAPIDGGDERPGPRTTTREHRGDVLTVPVGGLATTASAIERVHAGPAVAPWPPPRGAPVMRCSGRAVRPSRRNDDIGPSGT